MGNELKIFEDEVSVVLCGAAGLGIQTVEHILTRTLKLSGYNLFATKEFMSRIRGGSNSTSIRVSSNRVRTFSDRMDILIPLSKGAVDHVSKRLSPKTIVIGERSVYGDEYEGNNAINVPLSDVASEVGDAIYANTVAAAMICRLFEVDSSLFSDYLRSHFADKGDEIIDKNIYAANRGYKIGDALLKEAGIRIRVERDPRVKEEILINGTQGVAMGALAGGCDFVSFYPMTPGTGVPTFLSQHSDEFNTIVEQAEDEISAINMVVGSWYAGGRAMVSTSGGGFALMVEGLSLSAMLETPAVIHLGQRPGPATGLPTRTEQGDLLFALYSGHGEFPRVIYAPGNIGDCFHLTRRAFNVADKYQVPAIILTDQYLVDSYYNLPQIDVSAAKAERHISETASGYRRYEFTENGITPRGIPGYGDGLVLADSDEHDERGNITEDSDVRRRMVVKRLKKVESLAKDAVEPELYGDPDYHDLVIGWGSTYGAIKEAIDEISMDGLGFIHFKQVHPLPQGTSGHLKKAVRTILIENNATSQFGKLLRLEAGLEVDETILKWDGLAFSVEDIARDLKKVLGRRQ